MNWDALGAIGEVAGALVVVVTLIYLSRQVRNSLRESRLSAVHELSATYTAWIQSVAGSRVVDVENELYGLTPQSLTRPE